MNDENKNKEEILESLDSIIEDLEKVAPLILKYRNEPLIVSGKPKFYTIQLAEQLKCFRERIRERIINDFKKQFEEIIKHQSDIYIEECSDGDNCKLCKEFSELSEIVEKYNFTLFLTKKWDYDD